MSPDLTGKDIIDWCCVQVYIADAVPTMSLTMGLGVRSAGEYAARGAGLMRLVDAALVAAERTYPRGVALVRGGLVEVRPAYEEPQFAVVSRCP